MKVLVVGDIHISDNPPSIRTGTYMQDILDKIVQCVDIAKQHGVDAVVSVGDVFHIKAASRNSHALVQRTGEALTSAGLPVLIVPGNHDLQQDRLDSLSKQPLGTLAKMEGIELLIGPHPELPIYGIPYLHDWSGFLVSHMKKYRAWAEERKAEEGFDFWPLLISHAPIFPEGKEPPYDFISGAQWAGLMEVGDCIYGHIHDPHGVYRPNPQAPVWLCNNGAISRGSLHEHTLKREPSVTLWESEKLNEERFTRIPLNVRPVETVFRLHEKEDVDEKTTRVEEFLENVGSTRLDGLSLEEVADQARKRGLPERTQTLITDLLEFVA